MFMWLAILIKAYDGEGINEMKNNRILRTVLFWLAFAVGTMFTLCGCSGK